MPDIDGRKYPAKRNCSVKVECSSPCSQVHYHTWAFCHLWAAGGHLAVESVGISVWWSDFSILQALCKETQPDNLLATVAKYLEQFHEAPANI